MWSIWILDFIGIQIYKKNKAFFKKVRTPRTYEIRYEYPTEKEAAIQLLVVLKEMYPSLNFNKQPVMDKTEKLHFDFSRTL